ncbi:hypothetical protein SAMN05216191_12036 [Paenibacillus jilunlii]|uniref:Uncharacterized protein n=1 Tax=Paenibacillus jilunlii TaxID=682956 RepID=A0A1G9WUE8_9BACL|nr:hypothetical protein SAMN05216191_12036 [Paenibacillus jilunlii]
MCTPKYWKSHGTNPSFSACPLLAGSEVFLPLIWLSSRIPPESEVFLPLIWLSSPIPPKSEALLPLIWLSCPIPPKSKVFLPLIWLSSRILPKSEVLLPLIYLSSPIPPKSEVLLPLIYLSSQILRNQRYFILAGAPANPHFTKRQTYIPPGNSGVPTAKKTLLPPL